MAGTAPPTPLRPITSLTDTAPPACMHSEAVHPKSLMSRVRTAARRAAWQLATHTCLTRTCTCVSQPVHQKACVCACRLCSVAGLCVSLQRGIGRMRPPVWQRGSGMPFAVHTEARMGGTAGLTAQRRRQRGRPARMWSLLEQARAAGACAPRPAAARWCAPAPDQARTRAVSAAAAPPAGGPRGRAPAIARRSAPTVCWLDTEPSLSCHAAVSLEGG